MLSLVFSICYNKSYYLYSEGKLRNENGMVYDIISMGVVTYIRF